MPFKKFWNLAADSSDPNCLNMYVYGEICAASSFFGSEDDVVASHFIEDLNNYKDISRINVYINSPGGSVFAAAAIINQLKNHQATVHTWCDGICASAAVGILMAADKGCRHMSRATLLMIHNPSTQARGDKAVFLKTADLLDKVKNTLLNIYQEGTGLSKEQLSEMMDNETYLDADEALKFNFIDQITEDKVSYEFDDKNTLICNGISMDMVASADVQKIKEHLQKLSDNSVKNNVEGGQAQMNLTEVLDAITEEQRNVVLTEIESRINDSKQELQSEVEALKAEKESLSEQITDMQSQLEALQKPTLSAEEEMLANVSDEVKALLAQARADAISAQKALTEMREAQEFDNFKATLAEFDNLPIQEEHIKAMFSLSKNDEGMFNSLKDLLKVANQAMGKGFCAVGSDTGTDVSGGSASDVIEQRIKAYRATNSEADYTSALRAVLKDDPELYQAYRDGFVTEQLI